MTNPRISAEIVSAFMRRGVGEPLELTAEQWDLLRRMYPERPEAQYYFGGALGSLTGIPVVVKPESRRWWQRLWLWRRS